MIPTRTTAVKRPPDHGPDPTAALGLMERFSPLSPQQEAVSNKKLNKPSLIGCIQRTGLSECAEFGAAQSKLQFISVCFTVTAQSLNVSPAAAGGALMKGCLASVEVRPLVRKETPTCPDFRTYVLTAP